jgi:hypothetical protein
MILSTLSSSLSFDLFSCLPSSSKPFQPWRDMVVSVNKNDVVKKKKKRRIQKSKETHQSGIEPSMTIGISIAPTPALVGH